MATRTTLLKPSLAGRFSQSVWASPALLTATNCLAYALNCPQAGWARPGNLSERFNVCLGTLNITVATLQERLLKDGLRMIPKDEALQGGQHVIALRVHGQRDYHFLRRERDGTWSHKFGKYPPRSTDDAGAVITDPCKALLLYSDVDAGAMVPGYPDFAGYFVLPDDGIAIIERLEIADLDDLQVA